MNNSQFRRLLFDNSKTPNSPQGSSSTRGKDAAGSAKPATLGSKMRSNIPMTPRSVSGVNFAHQLAEYRRESDQPPSKKFKSSAAPKGTKYGSGYQDRALRRNETEGEDGNDQETRVQALQDMVKLGQIDQDTFEKLRAEIGIGGDIGTTHMVKGLDWELLRRIRDGEDVEVSNAQKDEDGATATADGGIDEDELERMLEEKEKDFIVPVATKAKEPKKGNMAPPPQPLTRNEILRQLKASRAGGPPMTSVKQPPPESTLGERFKKIGGKTNEKKRWVERDGNGRRREVLLTTDSEGKTKRKVRWLDKPGENNGDLLSVDKDAKPLGMEVPADVLARAKLEQAEDVVEEESDIFEGVGADYNPLADIDDDSSSSSDEDIDGEPGEIKPTDDGPDEKDKGGQDGKPPPSSSLQRRDYFATTTGTNKEPDNERSNPISSDPTILDALKRAAAIRQQSPTSGDEEGQNADKEAILRRRKFLEEAKKREREDAMDMDLGFGSSRFGDDDDENEPIWEEQAGGGNKRKRGPKKRKGDKESVNDVMTVLEGRRATTGDKDKRKAG